MIIDKAIEILAKHVYGGSVTLNQEFKDAEKLGVEALKREQARRGTKRLNAPDLLPGETEENDQHTR